MIAQNEDVIVVFKAVQREADITILIPTKHAPPEMLWADSILSL